VQVIEGFRACLLGTPIEWLYILPGFLTSSIIFVGGAFYFRRMEKTFADIV
jgi:lipopolysaccharide transport system permease protein